MQQITQKKRVSIRCGEKWFTNRLATATTKGFEVGNLLVLGSDVLVLDFTRFKATK
jgi:hypothetical protein